MNLAYEIYVRFPPRVLKVRTVVLDEQAEAVGWRGGLHIFGLGVSWRRRRGLDASDFTSTTSSHSPIIIIMQHFH